MSRILILDIFWNEQQSDEFAELENIDRLKEDNMEEFTENRYQMQPENQPGIRPENQREYASVLTRFGAIVIDGLIMVPFYIPIFYVSESMDQGAEPSEFALLIFFLSIIGMLVFGIWNTIVRMGKTGQSLGRKFLNIAVLRDSGEPIGVGRAALREIIGRWISGLVCYLGYLNAFWDQKRQMWHDKIADCYVYYVEDNFS